MLLAQRGIGLDDADDFVVLGQFSEGLHLARGMLMFRADLTDLDALLGLVAGDCVRLQPRSRRHDAGRGGGQEMTPMAAILVVISCMHE